MTKNYQIMLVATWLGRMAYSMSSLQSHICSPTSIGENRTQSHHGHYGRSTHFWVRRLSVQAGKPNLCCLSDQLTSSCLTLLSLPISVMDFTSTAPKTSFETGWTLLGLCLRLKLLQGIYLTIFALEE